MQAEGVHCLTDFHSPNTRLSLLKRVFLLWLMVADLFQRSASLREMRALLALALPMMVAQIAQVATGFVDTVMAGRVGTADLAAVSLGSSILITVTITFAGLLMALNPIIAHHFGAQEHQRIGSSFRQGLWMGLALGVIGLLLTLGLAYTVPAMLGVESQVAEQTKIYLIGAALGVPGFLLFRVFHATSSSLNHTKPIMVVSVLALILNVPLNYFFIHGWFGLPVLGGAGCGWATGLVFWFSALVLGAMWHGRHLIAVLSCFSRWSGQTLLNSATSSTLGPPLHCRSFSKSAHLALSHYSWHNSALSSLPATKW